MAVQPHSFVCGMSAYFEKPSAICQGRQWELTYSNKQSLINRLTKVNKLSRVPVTFDQLKWWISRSHRRQEVAGWGLLAGVLSSRATVKNQMNANKEHSESKYECRAFTVPGTITLLCGIPQVIPPLWKYGLSGQKCKLDCQITNVSVAGLLWAEICSICSFLLSPMLCRCILNYWLGWRMPALFIKEGDTFFRIGLQRLVFLRAAKPVFSNSYMLPGIQAWPFAQYSLHT